MEEELKQKEERGIRIGDKYILKADSMNLILEEYGFKGTSPKDLKRIKDEGITVEPVWGLVKTTYHATLEQVLNNMLNGEIIETDIRDLREVVQVVEKLRSEFEEFKNCTRLKTDTLEVIK